MQGPERKIWPVVGCEASKFSHVAQELGIVCPGGDLPQLNSYGKWSSPCKDVQIALRAMSPACREP